MDPQTETSQQHFGLPSIGIPAEVLFNPQLTLYEKMLFGFIRNLAHSKDGCFATNAYLGGLVGIKQRATTSAITNLKKSGCVFVQMDHKPDGSFLRRIYINYDYPKNFWKSVTSSKDAREDVLQCYPSCTEVLPPLHGDATKYANKEANYSANNSSDNTNVLSSDFPQENPANKQSLNFPDKTEQAPVETSQIQSAQTTQKSAADESDLDTNEIIEYWNTLSQATRHQIKPGSKTYQRIQKYVLRLLDSKPLLHTKEGVPTQTLLNFTAKFQIDESLLYQKWTSREIKFMLKKINDEDLRRDRKYPLDSVFWNGFAHRNYGFSYFLYKASQMIIDTTFLTMAKKLAGAVNPRLDRSRLLDWAKTLQHFVSQNGKTQTDVMETLKWYNVHADEKYTPSVSDAREFIEKYQKIIRAMKRQEQNDTESVKDNPAYQSFLRNQEKSSPYGNR